MQKLEKLLTKKQITFTPPTSETIIGNSNVVFVCETFRLCETCNEKEPAFSV